MSFLNNKEPKKETQDTIKVGLSTCGIAAGAQDVFDVLKIEAEKRKISVKIERCGCLGLCSAEPLVEVRVKDLPNVVYGNVTKDVAIKILEKHICGKRLVNDHIYEIG